MVAIQCVASCLLVVLAMLVTFGAVRIAANLAILVVGAAAFGGVLYFVGSGHWNEWPELIAGSLAMGVAAALLCLPALPFSSFYRKRK